MKLTICLVVLACLQVNARGIAQNVTLNENNANLESVLKKIEYQTGYSFIYEDRVLEKAFLVTLHVSRVPAERVLELCFRNQPLVYRIFDHIVVIKRKVLDSGLRKAIVVNMPIPDIVINGKVVNEEGGPIEGVSVVPKGSTSGSVTDAAGIYSIAVPENAILVFSYVGYLSQEVTVTNRTTINVILQRQTKSLGEVVVTALGIQRTKKSLSYATQSVNPNGLTQARSENLLQGLSGKVAGLTITNGSSGVGSESKVLLRGNRSVSGSSQPLYIVDGITLNGDISNLSPDDIESISVLKGANAAALYGSRASNGAIIVVTKSGKGAPLGVTTNIGFTLTANNPIILLKFQNEYGQGANGIYSEKAITSWGPKFDGSQVQHWSNDPGYIANELGGNTTYPYTAQPDNVKDFFQTGRSFAPNILVNIKSEKSNVSIGYTNTDASGIVRGNDLSTHNLSLRAVTDLGKRLRLDAKLNYIRQDFANILTTGESFNNPMRYLYQIPRNIRTQDMAHYQFINEQGQTRQHFWIPGFNGAGNPYWTRNNVKNPRELERVLGMMSLNYKITDNLSIQGRSALDRFNSMDESRVNNDTYVTGTNGAYSRLNSNSFEWNTDVLLNYHTQVSKSIRINLNAGANDRIFRADALGGSGVNFQIENLFSLTNTKDPRPTDNYVRHKEVQSVYAFGDISYKDAIFLNITGRNDWSSTLPANNRSYFYPSVGLSAVLSDLVKLPNFFTYAKVRGSYAQVGNDTDPYNLSRTAIISNGTISLSPTLPNVNLKPESIHSSELGLELRMLSGKIRLDITAYKSNALNQLFASPVPVASGVSSVFQNGADIQNKGIEVNLGASLVSNRDFAWDIDINFSKNNSKVLRIADGFDALIQSSDYLRDYKLVKGEPFGAVYSRGYVRDANGSVVVDDNGLPQVTVGHDVMVANFNPDWMGGITNTLRYKNFTLSALVDIRQGGSFISFTEAIESGVGVLNYTAKGRDGSLVFGENIFAGETAVSKTGGANKASVSAEQLWNFLGGVGAPVGETFVRSASNIRLREFVLGYSLPSGIIQKTPFTSARVSVVGRNLFFFSNSAKYVDPEIVPDITNSSEGRESLALPTTRSFGVSINFGF